MREENPSGFFYFICLSFCSLIRGFLLMTPNCKVSPGSSRKLQFDKHLQDIPPWLKLWACFLTLDVVSWALLLKANKPAIRAHKQRAVSVESVESPWREGPKLQGLVWCRSFNTKPGSLSCFEKETWKAGRCFTNYTLFVFCTLKFIPKY